jgi:hypothetical protein
MPGIILPPSDDQFIYSGGYGTYRNTKKKQRINQKPNSNTNPNPEAQIPVPPAMPIQPQTVPPKENKFIKLWKKLFSFFPLIKK